MPLTEKERKQRGVAGRHSKNSKGLKVPDEIPLGFGGLLEGHMPNNTLLGNAYIIRP